MGPGLVQVICRSMGYAVGSMSSSPCNFYGGADLCGAKGAPVVGRKVFLPVPFEVGQVAAFIQTRAAATRGNL